jgi:hypothetical protein
MDMGLMLVSAGIVNRLNGSNERLARSIGDIEVASSSRVSSNCALSRSGASRLVSAEKSFGG